MALRRLLGLQRNMFQFSKVESYTVKQENTVVDYKTLTYNPTKQIMFDSQEKSLLYYYKPVLWTYQAQYFLYLCPMFLIGKLIKNNPFYATFPAALPIMFVAEFWLFIKWFKKFKYLRYTVSEVYLYKDGQTIEVVYEKKFWRKVKEQSTKQIFYVTNLKTVKSDERKPLKGYLFPEAWPLTKLNLRKYKWSYVKYYLNQNNILVFPTNPNYVNSEILIQVMNGRIINTSKQFIQQVEGDMLQMAIDGKLQSEPFI